MRTPAPSPSPAVIVVNSGHRDFVFATRNRALQLRYLVRASLGRQINQLGGVFSLEPESGDPLLQHGQTFLAGHRARI